MTTTVLPQTPTADNPGKSTSPSPEWARRAHSETKLLKTKSQWFWFVLAIVLVTAIPLTVGNPFVISLGLTVGIFTIAVVGLNILTGYTGVISLSHSIFIGVGAFTGVGLGALLELPLVIWLPGCFIISGLIAAAIAPLTLRLKGVFQVILSLGMLFIGHYVFVNIPSLTGGNAGISGSPKLSLGLLDFGSLELFGMKYSYNAGLFLLVWFIVIASMVVVANMMRTKFGRSMVAVREDETAAQLAGIDTNAVKVKAFILAGAFGGLSGGLLLAQLRYVNAEQFGIAMGLELLIITVVGGLGTAWGPLLGSLVIASIPVLAAQYGQLLPFLKADNDSTSIGIPVGQIGLLVHGLALVLVMVFEPRGISHFFKAKRNQRRAHTEKSTEASEAQ